MNWVSVRAKPASTRGGKAPKAIYDAALWRRATIDFLRKFDPRTQVRNPVMFVVWLGALVTAGLTIDPALFGPSDASATYNGVVTVILLLDRLVREFCGGASGMPGQGEGRVATTDQGRTDSHPRESLGRHRGRSCIRLAQGRCGAGRAQRAHSGGRRGSRRRRLCERVCHYRRIRSGAKAARDGHVFDCHGRNAVDLGSAGRSGHGRSRRELFGSHDPSRRRRETPEDAERAGAHRAARHPHAHLPDRGQRDGAGCGLSAGSDQCRGSGGAAGRAHSHHHRRFVVGYRHRGHRPHVPLQHAGHVGESGRSGWRRTHAAPRQDRHDNGR